VGPVADKAVKDLGIFPHTHIYIYIYIYIYIHHTFYIRNQTELTQLDFDLYIPEDVTKYSWMRGPCDIDVEDLAYEISKISGLQEQLIEIKNN
jgi:hypothetical protein